MEDDSHTPITTTPTDRVRKKCTVFSSRTDLSTTRRQLLIGLTGGVALLAGCSNPLRDSSTGTQQTSPTTSRSAGTATATPTPTPTATDESLNLTPLTTYTNEQWDYHLKYPAHWTVDDSAPHDVEITNSEDDIIIIEALGHYSESSTLSNHADAFVNRGRRERTNFELRDRRKTTLQNGHAAIILDVSYEADGSSLLRNTTLITLTKMTVYQVEFLTDTTDWLPAVERDVTRILRSFTPTGDTGQ